MKIKFRLPNTRLCVVLWYDNNQPHEVLIDTPANNEMLQLEMLKHKVGWTQIRAVKAVETSGLLRQLV